MLEVYPLLSFILFLLPLFYRSTYNLFLIINATFWRTVIWLFLIHGTQLRGSFARLATATPLRGSGLCSCLLSNQPGVASRTPRDESQELSNFGEIPCLLYLDITEAKGTAGQQIGGRPLRHYTQFRESLCVLSLRASGCVCLLD